MKTASGSAFALAAALAVPLGAAAIGACSNEYTPHPPEIGGCMAIGDASCKFVSPGGGGGSSAQGDSGEEIDAPLDAEIEVTDALLACGGGTDQTIDAVATFSPACAQCLAAGLDAGLANCCSDATTCSMDVQCFGIVTCELNCTGGSLCCASLAPPVASLTNYNLLAQCAAQVCSGLCPMLQHLSPTD